MHKSWHYLDALAEYHIGFWIICKLCHTARILRGLRIAARLSLSISKETETAIHRLSSSILTLAKVPRCELYLFKPVCGLSSLLYTSLFSACLQERWCYILLVRTDILCPFRLELWWKWTICFLMELLSHLSVCFGDSIYSKLYFQFMYVLSELFAVLQMVS